MSIIEKQAELGKSLFDINANTLKELATLQRTNIETYFETNRTFGGKLPEVKGIGAFVELQREYSEALWGNARKAVETQNEILRTAFQESSEVVRSAFSSAADDVKSEVTAQAESVKKAVAQSK